METLTISARCSKAPTAAVKPSSSRVWTRIVTRRSPGTSTRSPSSSTWSCATRQLQVLELTNQWAERAVSALVLDPYLAVHATEPHEQAGLGEAQAHEHDEGHHHRGDERYVDPRTRRNPHCGADPQRCRRREAAHGSPAPQYGSCTDEPDTGRNLGGDARRIGSFSVANVFEAISAGDGEHRGADRHERVRANAGIVTAQLPLQPNDPTDDRGHDHLEGQVEVRVHDTCVPAAGPRDAARPRTVPTEAAQLARGCAGRST
jgi:hypothetical protein